MTTLMLAVAAAFSFGEVKVECQNQGDWKVALEREVAPDGAEVAKITFDNAEAKVPPKTTLSLKTPQVGMDYVWNVNESDCGIHANWGGWSETEVARGMPVFVYFDGNDTSHFAVAAEECTRHLRYGGGICEEGSLLNIQIVYFDAVEAPMTHYETRVRFDSRSKYFADAVRESVGWVEKTAGYTPCKPPKGAYDPLYSSWYNFHQDVHAADLEAELAIAAKLGMKTFIVDDGWQTDDNNRGYAFCGDWQVSSNRFPDMAGHVKRVQDMGIKYMMWYSVPFIGHKSANFPKFKGKYITEDDRGMGAGVLDPRFPEVRKFLVDTYVKALNDWNIDGFKLDFIDTIRFRGPDPAVKENYAGRDIKSLPLAVDRLMTEVKDALTAIKPDILVEFRQSYVGPAIRKYGNMLRVGDCPGNIRRNRFAMANLRLASGETAVHSDMLEWNFKETPDKAALYIINSMFGVVQYSIMLRNAPKDHLDMIEKWIKFSQDHRETLQHGKFKPHHPELQYPVIEAEGKDEVVIGLYDDGRVLDVPADKKTFVMNASGKDSFIIRRNGKLSEVSCKSGDWIELGRANLLFDVKSEDGKVTPVKLRLGLDLKGGTSFTLGVDEDKLRSILIGKNPSLTNAPYLVDAAMEKVLEDADDRIVEVLRRRIDGMGVNEPVIQIGKNNSHRLTVQLPGIEEDKRNAARESIQRMAFLEFRLVHPQNEKLVDSLLSSGACPEGYVKSSSGDGYVKAENYAEVSTNSHYMARFRSFHIPSPGYVFMLSREGKPFFVSRKVELTGDSLVSAKVERDPITGKLSISFRLNSEGAEKLADLTRNYKPDGARNAGKEGRLLAIVLDDQLCSAPRIQSKIPDGRGEISGGFTNEEAKQLVNALNAGALPAPLKILSESPLNRKP